jgi:UPF0755 protein
MNVNKALFAFIKIIFTIMVALMVIVAAVNLCITGYDYGYRFFTEQPVSEAPGEDILVQVKEDTSGMELARMLENKGLIRDAKLFYMRWKLSAYSNSIKPGVYTLNTSMTPKEMMIAMSPQEESQLPDNTEAAEATEETK